MLFAAGFGTRMGALTATCPKPLIKVAGKPLIDHALGVVADAGIGTVVVNTHYLPEMMQTHLADQNLTLLHEPDILETGGGLRNALPHLGKGPVFTFNSDAVWKGKNPLTKLANRWDPDQMDALLLLIPPTQARGHQGVGDFILGKNGALTRGPGLVYSGAQIIKTDRLHNIASTKFSLNLLWETMIANGRIFGVAYNGGWCDVGTPEGIIIAANLLEGANV